MATKMLNKTVIQKDRRLEAPLTIAAPAFCLLMTDFYQPIAPTNYVKPLIARVNRILTVLSFDCVSAWNSSPFWGDRHPIGTPGLGSTLASMIMEAEVGMLIVETIAKIRRAFFVRASGSRRSVVS